MVRAGFRMIVESQTDMRIAGEAGDGQEAIDLVNRERPDVILMDVRMPRLDGIAATRQVADITQGRHPHPRTSSTSTCSTRSRPAPPHFF